MCTILQVSHGANYVNLNESDQYVLHESTTNHDKAELYASMIQMTINNSLGLARCSSNFNSVIHEHLLRIIFMSTTCEIALRQMALNTSDDKSTPVPVLARCQVPNHYLSPYWPRYLSPHGVTRSKSINNVKNDVCKMSAMSLRRQCVNNADRRVVNRGIWNKTGDRVRGVKLSCPLQAACSAPINSLWSYRNHRFGHIDKSFTFFNDKICI